MGNSRRKRYKKRLQVRFWRDGDDKPHTGYTTNVSMNGMFIATNTPVAPNERIRVEIIDESKGCHVHGEVVHAARVSPLLAKLRQAGMGIRLLGVDELLSDLLSRDRTKLREEVEFRVHAPMRTGFDRPAIPGEDADGDTAPKSSTARPAETPFDETVSPFDPTLFSVRFENNAQFLEAFRKELQHGGLFISTQHPPDVDEEVTVEITPPKEHPVRLPARVVSRRNPGGAPDSRTPPGINVDFKDVKTALEELKRLRELAQDA